MQISIEVNGEAQTLEVEGRETLLDLLRNRLGLNGTKRVCDDGVCGQCSVLLDGLAVNACILLAGSARDRHVETIESLSRDGILDPLQQALIDGDALACGFCAPAWLMTVTGLLRAEPQSDRAALRQALSGIRCRCDADPSGAFPSTFRGVATGRADA